MTEAECSHEWTRVGCWDGAKPEQCGPIAQCQHCEKEIYPIWSEWETMKK